MPAIAATQWPPRELLTLQRRLDELAQLVASPLDAVDDDARDWLARLLVIRSCGYLEQCVAATCRGYIAGRAGGPVKSFGVSWLERSSNPSADGLQGLVGRFDSMWAAELAEELDANDERMRRDLAFLVDRRHKIAHGLNENVRVPRALELKDTACDLADWFIRRFNPDRP
jgi:hypothetical protein